MQPAAKRVAVDEVREGLLPVDGDDGDPLPVPALELLVAGDVDLAQVERDVGADALEDRPRAVAEVAAPRAEERDDGERRQG